MTNLTDTDLFARAVLADREREAQAVLRAGRAGVRAPGGLRVGFAARLARLALRLDQRAARCGLAGDSHTPLTNGRAG